MNKRFGIFKLGEMQLALPLDALSEVVPCRNMIPIPSAAQGVIGGVDIRGRLVPVVELSSALGIAMEHDAAPDRVVVLMHENRMLGLAANDTHGVFEIASEKLGRIEASVGLTLLSGCFPHPDDNSPVSVLSPSAVLSITDMPSVADAGPDVNHDSSPIPERHALRHTMLFRCGGVPAAIESVAVLATLLKPVVMPSAVAQGYCRGVLAYGGFNIPAVDLARLCGFAMPPGHAPRQAFIVRYAEGVIAYLVDEILDVLDIDHEDVAPVPTTLREQADYLSGFLPMTAVSDSIQARFEGHSGYFMVLDSMKLTQAPQLQALATVITPEPGAGEASLASLLGERQDGSSRRQILTFDLGFEAASPIEHFSEILPWARTLASPDPDEASIGMVMHRGRAVPVYSLARLLGLPTPVFTATASVLIVEGVPNQAMAFAVSGLHTIDDAPADKLDQARAREDASSILSSHFRDCWSRMMIGRGDQERMRGILDLRKLATALLQPEPALAA